MHQYSDDTASDHSQAEPDISGKNFYSSDPALAPASNRLMRRDILKTLTGGLVACAAANSLVTAARAATAVSGTDAPPRSLSFRNVHTLEELSLTYWKDGKPIDEALLRISHHMRDHRENETMMMDPALLDILWLISQKIDPKIQFDVISGYRTPKTNEMLRKRSNGVAKRSLHMLGKAVDISCQSTAIKNIRDVGLAVKGGGVGYYPSSRFVHLDTGPVRNW